MLAPTPITLGQYCICTQFKIGSEELKKFKSSFEKSARNEIKVSHDKFANQ